MRCHITALLGFAAATFTTTAAAEETAAPSDSLRPKDGCTPWSIRMATSIMSRRQGILTGTGDSSELLQAGFTQRVLTALAAQYRGSDAAAKVEQYIHESAVSVVPVVSNASLDALAYPLDRLSSGISLLTLPESTQLGAEAAGLRGAGRALRQSIDLNRRNKFGGLWYYVYPEWSYLDGMYSLAPFYTFYSISQASEKVNVTAIVDMQKQIGLLWDITHKANGLLVHGYDASRTAVWANPVTGASPLVWGRSLGWFAMALVDTAELLESASKGKNLAVVREAAADLRAKFRSLAPALITAADPATGGWYQIVDQQGRQDNYIESSGSAMFAYALLKGARLGYIDAHSASKAKSVGVKAQKYLTDAFVIDNHNGTYGWNGTVAVCSLNSTATYDYYTHRPILFNSVLGSAAYVLASLETEKLKLD